MSESIDPRIATWEAVNDPRTSGTHLAAIAQSNPEFAGAIAVHPQAYPALIDWAQQVLQTQALPPTMQREAEAPRAAVGSPSPELTASPSAPQRATPRMVAPQAGRPLLTPFQERPAKASGWEKADKVVDGVGAVVNGTATVIMKLYGLGLLIAGIAIIIVTPAGWWAGLLVAAYGVYLLLPGGKLVIW